MNSIFPLSEGAFTVDQTKAFVPFNKETDDLQQRTKGSLLVEIQPFLVVTEHDKILLDTGLGFEDESGTMQLHENLGKHGIQPSEITKVLLSHLHKDHSGGILLPGKSAPAFPNAVYYINRQEWNLGLEKKSASYHPKDFLPLEQTGQLQLTDGNGIIDNYISYQVTGGHSPFHQVFTIQHPEGTIFFGGDVAPQLYQMKSRFKAKYDYDGQKALDLRQQWREEGEEEHWTFLFYHDIKYPTFKF
jgi:glyoxylase-like metal-dependent hydrolase (beta-lactamase superfamily II)